MPVATVHTDMRPSIDTADAREYECLDCGGRVTDPSTPVCEACGGPLRSLGPERDL